MRAYIKLFVFVVALLAVNPAFSQSTFEVALLADEGTDGDLDIVATGMEAAADGAAVSKSLRGMAMAVAGEAHLQLKGLIDESGNLKLDDGSAIALAGGDRIQACRKKLNGAIVCISFSYRCNENKICHLLPTSLRLVYPEEAGKKGRIMAIPPNKVNHCGEIACEEPIDPGK